MSFWFLRCHAVWRVAWQPFRLLAAVLVGEPAVLLLRIVKYMFLKRFTVTGR